MTPCSKPLFGFRSVSSFGSLLAAHIALLSSVQGAILTGILIDSCDETGTSHVRDFWNTFSDDFVWNIFFTVNTGDAGPFVNGPADSTAGPISVDLSSPGNYTFVSYMNPVGLAYADINLFFDGENRAPRISAKTMPNTLEAFSPNTGTSLVLAPAEGDGPLTSGAGSLFFHANGHQITLIDFRWYDPGHQDADLPAGDRVGAWDANPDGIPDARALFKLRVSPAPTLSIAPVMENSVSVSWPSSFAAFSLWQNSEPAATGWTPVAEAPVDDGVNFTVVTTAGPGTRYFRLAMP